MIVVCVNKITLNASLARFFFQQKYAYMPIVMPEQLTYFSMLMPAEQYKVGKEYIMSLEPA